MASEQTILLVVDAQEGFRNTETAPVIPEMVATLRSSTSPVVFSKFVNLAGSNFERLLKWPNMKKGTATQMLAEILPFIGQDLLFEKSVYSVFSNVSFTRYLENSGTVIIEICGFDTDACVLATALDAFDAGYQPKILAHACASGGGITLHNAAIEILERNLGKDAIIRGRTNGSTRELA